MIEMGAKRATQIKGWLKITLQVDPSLHLLCQRSILTGLLVSMLGCLDEKFHYLVETLLGRLQHTARKESNSKTLIAFLKKSFIFCDIIMLINMEIYHYAVNF